jgi:hypothetical protein
MLNKTKTNFEKKIELAPEDRKSVEGQIDFLVNISFEMSNYLD